MDPKILDGAQAAKDAGFADFNNVPHLAVDAPDGNFTITVKTSEGKRITFAFLEYTTGGPAQCVDVCYHDGPTAPLNGKDMPMQEMILFGCGNDVFDTRKLAVPDKPIFATVLMHE